MGRSGYNGGGPAVRAPKSDNVYIFASDPKLQAELLSRSKIVQSGENLKNEGGGVQLEFGYLLEVNVETKGQATQPEALSKFLGSLRRPKRKRAKNLFKWVAASDLLNKAPEGPLLARKFHAEFPDAPQPWGFKQLNRDS